MRRQQRKLVALWAQADDGADGDVREVRMSAEFFAGVHVADVNLYEGNRHGEQRIAQRHARMRECARIEDDEIGGSRGLLDMVDEFRFRVALQRGQRVAQLLSGRRQLLDNVGQRRAAVDPGLARAEQVQVRAIK